MRSGDETSSEVYLSIFVFDWLLVVTLVIDSIAVNENSFGPVSENIFGLVV